MPLQLYNSLTRKIEEFKSISDGKVTMYTCGPTVYDYVSVGNWRTYALSDFLLRTFKYMGYEVSYVMNITDVGHLTGDNEGDADTGLDRMEKAAARENKTAWEVADFYTKDFLRGFDDLNLVRPKVFAKATEHIQEQIALVKKIEKADFTYRIGDGIYFDIRAYEKSGNKYGELSTLDDIKAGVRVAENKEKKDQRDFALWKFNTTGKKRDMEWDSPWGIGFPGWHIECSAMSMKYLGEKFDIHVGGEDLKSTHHPNEIAQSEAATGNMPFVKYWIHGSFLLVEGGKMGKSLGNAYPLQILKQRNIEPMVLRYFYLTGHYRKQLNFTWKSLYAAKTTYMNLVDNVSRLKTKAGENDTDMENLTAEYRERFIEALSKDLNMPEALAVMWDVMRGKLDEGSKYELVMEFDQVFGLGLSGIMNKDEAYKDLPVKVRELVEAREGYRKVREFENADAMRKQIEKMGYVVEDMPEGSVVSKKRG